MIEKPTYQKMPVSVNLCTTSLEDAALVLGPCFAYDLTVSTAQQIFARLLMRDIGCAVRNNPFAPYVNIHVCDAFARDEWCIAANGKAIGCVGP